MKLLVLERGTADAKRLWAQSVRRVSSLAAYPEVRAALGSAQRSGRVDPGQLAGCRQDFETLWDEVDAVALSPEVARRAGGLAEEHALRGYDAVHLASAEAVGEQVLVLVSGDTRLLAGGTAIGLAVAPLH